MSYRQHYFRWTCAAILGFYTTDFSVSYVMTVGHETSVLMHVSLVHCLSVMGTQYGSVSGPRWCHYKTHSKSLYKPWQLWGSIVEASALVIVQPSLSFTVPRKTLQFSCSVTLRVNQAKFFSCVLSKYCEAARNFTRSVSPRSCKPYSDGISPKVHRRCRQSLS